MKHLHRTGLVAALAALALCLAPPARSRAAESSPPTPRGVIESVVSQALAILRDAKLSPVDKRQKVEQIAYATMDFGVMGRLSLGRYYRGLTEAQKAEYATAFKQYVTDSYRHTTDQYTDQDVKITGERKEADGDSTVTTQIVGGKSNQPGQNIAKVDYRLRANAKDNTWKVIDLTIDGVSLVSNYRSQFQDIMTNGGFDRLIALMRQKNAENAK